VEEEVEMENKLSAYCITLIMIEKEMIILFALTRIAQKIGRMKIFMLSIVS
jgi:hypothetical protein